MSANAGSTTVRTTLIRILAETNKSINELKDLGSQLTHTAKAYFYLKTVLANMVKTYDELDSVVRRTTDGGI